MTAGLTFQPERFRKVFYAILDHTDVYPPPPTPWKKAMLLLASLSTCKCVIMLFYVDDWCYTSNIV